jgi:hypothetical protein
MAYDEQLAERIRAALPGDADVGERKMMGSLIFMVNGHMTCGARREGGFLARVGPDAMDAAVEEPGVEPMFMRDRIMPGYVHVDGDVVRDDAALQGWVDRCVEFTGTLPTR